MADLEKIFQRRGKVMPEINTRQAFVIEGAEAIEHHGWKWWKKQDCDLPQLQMEIIDIWHFLLSEILLQHEALPNTIRSGQIANIRGIIESGKEEGMITMDNSLMARVKDGTVEPKEAYMKGSNKALFAPLL